MKKIFILASILLLNVILTSAQGSFYKPFTINEVKSSAVQKDLESIVADAKIVDVNFNTLNTIVDRRENSISITLPFNGEEINATLQRFDVLTDNARIVAGTTTGDRILNRNNDFVAYTSDLHDKNAPLVVVTFFRNDVTAMIISEKETYVLAKQKDSDNFIAYRNSKIKHHNEFKCGADEMGIPDRITQIQKDLTGNLNPMASSTLLKANIAVESDFEFYSFWGNSVERASNYIISLYVPVSAIYTRDINVQLQITYLRVWDNAGDPYPDATASNTLLTAFRSYWNANMSGTQRTIAHFISTRPGGLGGIAYVDVLCASTSNGYGYAFSDVDGTFNQLPTYSWDCMVVAHETGHNFGSPHTHSCSWPGGPIDSCYTVEGGCYSGPQIPRVGTIMSYCHLNGSIALYFGPLPTQLIRNRAETAGCINSLSGYLVATPNGGQLFRSGSNALIIWGTSNTGNVDIEFTSNNGSSWQTIQNNVDATLRTVNWTIPYISTTTQARVRVIQTGNPGNGDQSDSVFQIRPLMNSFYLISPPQLHREYVYAGDTSRMIFTFNRSGTLPEFKYKWQLSTINNSNIYTANSNNSGSDTVFSITRGRLDSIVSAWGAPNTGDSLRLRWTVKCYTQFDSLTSSAAYLITFLRSVIGIQQISSTVPDKYFINPNYPNPFNPETKIKFGLPASSNVRISVYDMLGREVDILMNGKLEAGEYLANWNASNFASGIYIYKIDAVDLKGNRFVETRKMVLVK